MLPVQILWHILYNTHVANILVRIRKLLSSLTSKCIEILKLSGKMYRKIPLVSYNLILVPYRECVRLF